MHLRVLLLLAALLLPGVAGAVSPAQTIVDAVPVVVEQAIREARFDGTPDEAEATVALMREFVRDFEALPLAPGGTELDDPGQRAAYPFAARLTAITAALPGDIAIVERRLVACQAWAGNATVEEAKAWGEQLRPASLRLLASFGALEAEAEQLPVEAAPLNDAIERLRGWYARDALEVRSCQQDLEVRLGIPVDEERLLLRVLPNVTWPGGEVLVLGIRGNVSRPTPVALDLGPLGTASVFTDADGAFRYDLPVPPDHPLGTEIVTATVRGLAAEAELLIGRVPTRIVLEAPGTVLVGSGFNITVSVLSPGVIGAGPVRLEGDLEGQAMLDQGSVQFAFNAPSEPTRLQGTAIFAGTSTAAPAEQGYRIDVRMPASTVAAAEASTPGPQAPTIPWDFLAGTVVAVVAVALLSQVLWRKRPRIRGARRPVPAPDAPFSPPRQGFVKAFAALLTWLIRVGRLSPATTPRESTAWFADHGIPADRVVHGFERSRYGGAPEPERARRQAPRWVRRAWDRLRRSL